MLQDLNPGGTQVRFCRDMPLQNSTHTYTPTQIQEKMIHSYTNLLNLGPKFEQNHPIFTKFLAQIWENFEKKKHPFIYQILHFIRVHSYTKRLILLPMLVAYPHRVFCNEYPHGTSSKATSLLILCPTIISYPTIIVQ